MYICAKGVFHACRVTIIKVMSMWVSPLGYNHMYTCTYVHNVKSLHHVWSCIQDIQSYVCVNSVSKEDLFVCETDFCVPVIIECQLCAFHYTVDCEWEWGAFSRCSRTCGVGTKTRHPIIKRPAQHGGMCPTEVLSREPDTLPCNTDPCPREYDGEFNSLTIKAIFSTWTMKWGKILCLS